jgi:hypothetical protein
MGMRYSLELLLYVPTSVAVYLGAVWTDLHSNPPGELSGLVFWALIGGTCFLRRPPEALLSDGL